MATWPHPQLISETKPNLRFRKGLVGGRFALTCRNGVNWPAYLEGFTWINAWDL